MNKPNKLSNRTKRKIREQLTQERRSREETNRHAKANSTPLWYAVPEKKDSPLEMIGGCLAVLLTPVAFGLATIIFGS